MTSRNMIFAMGLVAGALGCTAATILAQGPADEPGLIPPGGTPNGLLIRASRGGLIAIRDEWGGVLDPDDGSAGDWERVVELVVEREIVRDDVGLQHDDGTLHDHCRVRVGSRTYSYHC